MAIVLIGPEIPIMDGPKEVEVFFKPGRTNSIADALSRRPTGPAETYASPNVNLSSPEENGRVTACIE